MIAIAQETLIFRREGIAPSLRLLVPTFLLPHAPAWLTPLPSQQEWNTLLPLVNFIKERSFLLNIFGTCTYASMTHRYCYLSSVSCIVQVKGTSLLYFVPL